MTSVLSVRPFLFVIPTEGRNLLSAGAANDSRFLVVSPLGVTNVD